jgi:Tol biopolymer transport system component
MTKVLLAGLLCGCALVTAVFLDPGSGEARPGPLIAFSRSDPRFAVSHLFVMNPDGSGLHQVTRGNTTDGDATWSPDGRRLVFERMTGLSHVDIYVVAADGSGLHRLTKTPGSWTPAWSPDGRRIAYGSIGHLFVMDADGRHKRALTTRFPARPSAPSWSPDGKRIAFAVGAGLVYVVNVDGTQLHRLPRGHGFGCPAWSPDGRWVAFAEMPFHYASLYVIDGRRAAARERRLTRHAYTESGYAWSPNSRGLVYARERHGGVFTIGLDGSHRRLTANPLRPDLSAGGFSWSSNRRLIAYASEVTGAGDIYVMNANGRGQRQLTQGPDVDGAPRWSLSPRTESC